MHVFLHASAPDRIPSLTTELRDGGFSVVQIDSAFFRSDPETLRARSLDRTSFLLVQNPRLLDQIRRLRAAKFDGPILVLRDSRDPGAAAASLDAGADDDLVTPVPPVELRARINSITRRAAGHAAESLMLGEAQFYFDGRHPEICGREVRLSQREYAIFHELALGGGRCVSKRALYDAIYGMSEEQPFDKVIDVFICKLRKKFAAASSVAHPYIETVHGRGYKLSAPAERQIEAAE
jgi:two-component system cell cycle response regulator CtrA